jgi:predicted anti-sigma-YlaC factor YlaD
VAHLTDGTLRRMFDDPDARVGANGTHLESCAECQARFKDIADDARSIATLLAVPEPRVDVASAFARMSTAQRPRPSLTLGLPVRRPALALVAAAVAAAVVIVAFTFSGFFFQPTKVQAVPITLSDIQALSELANYGTVTWTQQPQMEVGTNAPATGLQAPVVSKLPKGVSTTVTYGSMSQAQATFTFSAAKASVAAAAQGKSLPALPKNMDGATLTVTLGPAVGEVYGEMNQPTNTSQEINLPQLIVAKSVSPKVTSTQVTTVQLEDYILQQPGISADLKKTIKAIGDPSKTLFIPVPVEYAHYAAVTVQGVDGVALGDNTGLGSGVVWIKDGYVYAVAGSIKQADALEVANNLK